MDSRTSFSVRQINCSLYDILFEGNFAGRTQTMPLAIYQTMESDLGAALAAAAVLVFISFGFLVILRLITRGRITHPLF